MAPQLLSVIGVSKLFSKFKRGCENLKQILVRDSQWNLNKVELYRDKTV